MSFAQWNNRNLAGCAAVITSATIYGFSPMISRFCLDAGMDEVTLELLVSLLAIPVLAIAALKTEHTLKIPRGEGWALLLLGVLITATNLLLLCAYLFIPTGIATSLHFLYPVLVVLLSWLFFGEKIGRRMGVGLGACLAGTGFLLSENPGGNLLGVGCALLSALAYSLYIVLLSKKIRRMRSLVMVFYLMVVQGVICGMVSLAKGTLRFNFPLTVWGLLLLMALINGILACVLFRKGIQLVGANQSAILSLFEPLVSVAASAFILKETFTWVTLAGCSSIILGLSVVIGRRKEDTSNR